MKTATILTAALATWAFSTTTARAQVPNVMPVQGVLSDSSNMPLSGDQTVQFTIYDAATGGNSLFAESHVLSLSNGTFTAQLGSVQTLDLSIFRGDVYLGVKVGSDAEMTPRLKFGTVPFAAYAQECASVPAGAVMFFNLASCPAGWTEFAALTGRVPVGAGGGTLGATMGTALGNQGARTITEVPAHKHVINPPATNTSTNGAHNHGGATGGGNLGVDLSNGGYSTSYVQGAASNGTPDLNRTAPVDSHTHSITTDGSHYHSVDIDPFDSEITGTSAVDVTMPYVQLRACVKN